MNPASAAHFDSSLLIHPSQFCYLIAGPFDYRLAVCSVAFLDTRARFCEQVYLLPARRTYRGRGCRSPFSRG